MSGKIIGFFGIVVAILVFVIAYKQYRINALEAKNNALKSEVCERDEIINQKNTYIKEMEKLLDVSEVGKLQLAAIYDFAERMARSRIPLDMTKDIYDSIQYISTHLNERISVESVAESIGKSRSYLSRKFKSELGFQISDYIMRRKLEEAKVLLSYTDKSLSEISEYLCFSSQPYFQNVFKKKYGVTPGEYRKKVELRG